MSDEMLHEKEFKAEIPKSGVVATVAELQGAVIRAKSMGQKSLVVTKDVLQFLLSGQYDEKTGFMIFQDVFLIEDGKTELVAKRLNMTMEEIVFPGAPSGVQLT